MKFTTRQLIGLSVVMAVCAVLALLVAPADPVSMIIAAVVLFLFGGGCYVAGVLLGRE